MSKVTDINEFRAKKLDNIDYRRVAAALMAVEDMMLELEREYQQQEAEKTGELS